MLAFLSVETTTGLVIHDLRLMTGRDGPWVAPPAKLQVDKDGQPRIDTAGKKLYSPLIEFRDAPTAARFKREILEAIRRQHPEVLDGAVS
jgi:DNA-binding cell septation regulator SpoVG